jgi:octaheme c-type cytochrome (tetrathionate reductase family)
MKRGLKDWLETLAIVVLLPVLTVVILFQLKQTKSKPVKPEVLLQADMQSAADHKSYEYLQQDFETPHQVTAACLKCHTKREEIMATAHWRWERTTEIPGRGEVSIGKKNLINNFCTGATGNNGSCMRCHIGYGWEDKSFDFEDPNNIDCLVCHDQTGTYFKQSGQAGMPATKETANEEFPVPDYNLISQNVGLPKRENCGICHFNGGGGNNVKHGDLEQSLLDCSRDVDVHMSVEGGNMQCVDCHTTENHNIKGKLYSVSAANTNRITCEQCHTAAPHQNRVYDHHTSKVACQTCHIPTYAKVNATKLWWDWSSAGELKQGNPYHENDFDGNHNYLTIKGNFVWDNEVEPEYYWFNGTADHYLTGDKINPDTINNINTLLGDYHDKESKIWPVKVHRGMQIYDTGTNELINLKLWAAKKGEGAFWKDFDFDTAAVLGMQYNGREYSGGYDFVRTDAYWPVNHMVAPKEKTLSCVECHSREGRLAGLDDFYLPGKSYNAMIDWFGIGAIILAILGVVSHAIGRYVNSLKHKKTTKQ